MTVTGFKDDPLVISNPDGERSVWAGMTAKGLEITIWISNDFSWVRPAMAAWNHASREVGIEYKFKLPDILNQAIAFNETLPHCESVNSEIKPMFDAMRLELAQMIERIDQLQYSNGTTVN
jgi:hypothetical protein